jgi:hypothetical protein
MKREAVGRSIQVGVQQLQPVYRARRERARSRRPVEWLAGELIECALELVGEIAAVFPVVDEHGADLLVDERERGGPVDRGEKLPEPATHGSGGAAGWLSLAMISAVHKHLHPAVE